MSHNEEECLTEKLNEFFTTAPTAIHILVVGKTGAGKTSIVNSLLGKEVAKESHGANSCTKSSERYTGTIRCAGEKDTEIVVWDTPGYDEDEEEDAYFKELKNAMKDDSEKIDLLLFCIPLNERRWRKDDEGAMKTITRHFGPSIWNNAMIALTQANLIQDSNGQVTKEAYDEKLRQWTDKIDAVIKSLGVETKVLTVPTGNSVDMSLPNTDDWFSEFWTKAFSSISADKRVALLKANERRIQVSRAGRDRASGSSEEPRHPAPRIKLSDGQLMETMKSVWEAFVVFSGASVPLFKFVSAATSGNVSAAFAEMARAAEVIVSIGKT